MTSNHEKEESKQSFEKPLDLSLHAVALQAHQQPENQERVDMTEEKQATAIHSFWKTVVEHPERLTAVDKTVYVAGGGLPLVFLSGNDSEISNLVQQAITENGKFEVAGISLLESQVQMLGDYYRFLQSKGLFLTCIDERLVETTGHYCEAHVHGSCGACAALQQFFETALKQQVAVEDVLKEELTNSGISTTADKQPIYEDLPDHDSLTMFVSLTGKFAPEDATLRQELKAIHALPFNISLKVEDIQDFVSDAGYDQVTTTAFLKALVSWNVQIARNIIGGGHNMLEAEADESSLLVIDTREVDLSNPIAQELMELIKAVPHGAEMQIA